MCLSRERPMPQIDKLLAHITPRGGVALRWSPTASPCCSWPTGRSLALLPNPIPSTMIEMLAREVLPSRLEEAWHTRGEATFDHSAGSRVVPGHLHPGPPGHPHPGRRPGPPRPRAAPAVPARLPRPRRRPPPAPAASRRPPPGTHPLAEALFPDLLARQGSDLHCSSFETPLAGCTGTWRTCWTSASWAPASCWRSWRPSPRPRPGTSSRSTTTPISPTPSRPAAAACG